MSRQRKRSRKGRAACSAVSTIILRQDTWTVAAVTTPCHGRRRPGAGSTRRRGCVEAVGGGARMWNKKQPDLFNAFISCPDY